MSQSVSRTDGWKRGEGKRIGPRNTRKEGIEDGGSRIEDRKGKALRWSFSILHPPSSILDAFLPCPFACSVVPLFRGVAHFTSLLSATGLPRCFWKYVANW